MQRHQRFALAAAMLFAVAPLAAQSTSVTPDSTRRPVAASATVNTAVPSAGPTLETATVGIRTNTATAPLLSPQPPSHSSSWAMMVVGAAGLIVGAVVGGDSGTIIMVGSGLLGLYGLFHYIQ